MGGMATEQSSLSKAKGDGTAPSGQAGAAARASDTGAPRSFITPAFPQAETLGPGATFAAGSASPSLRGKREPERAGFAAKPIRGNRKRVRKLSEPGPYSYAKTMEDRSHGQALPELGRADGFGQGGRAGQAPSTSGNDTNAQILEIIRRRQQEAKTQAKTIPPTTLLKQPELPELRTPDGNAPRNLLESAQALAAQRRARDAANPTAQPAGLQPAVFRPGQSLPGGFMPTGQGGIVQARSPSGDTEDWSTSLENVKNAATTWVSDAWDATKDKTLDLLEREVRGGIRVGKTVGLDESAKNLEHFLDGKGADVNIPRDEARKRDFIREAEETNRNRFVESLLQDRKADPQSNAAGNDYLYRSQLSNLKDGQSIDIRPSRNGVPDVRGEKWDTGRKDWQQLLAGRPDELLAYGSSQFTSEAESGFKASREGDTITVTGIVTHSWGDRYDFHGSDDYYGLMNTLRDSGRAAEFDSKTSWQQEMTAKIRLQDGKPTLESVDWADLEPGS